MNDLLKNELRYRNVFEGQLIDTDGQSEYALKMVQLWKEGTTAYLNLKLRNPNAAANATKVLQSAMRFDLTKIVLFLSEELMKFYPYQGNKAQTDYFQDIFNQYQLIFQAEYEAETALIDIDKRILKKLSNRRIAPLLDQYIQSIDQKLHEFHSLNFLLNAYKLKLRQAQLDKNNQAILDICEEAMGRLRQKKFKLPFVVDVLFTHPFIPIYIENSEFHLAEKIIEGLYSKIKKGTVNWFVPHSYDVILNFRKLDFEKVGKLLDQFKRYNNEVHQERYIMYYAFLSLFSKREFRLGKFTNQVFQYSKDKEGYKVTIIIIQLLHLLKYKKYGLFIDRKEAIERFMYRYLKSTSSSSLRSRYFLKVLLSIPEANFNQVAFERKTKSLLAKIKNTPIQSTQQLLEQEPLNYEYLYFFIKSLLK